MHVGKRPKTHLPLAITAIIAAALMNAVLGAFVKFISKGLTVEGMTFWRNFICLLLMIPWLSHENPHQPWSEKLKPRHVKMHLVRGLSGLAAIFLFFTSLQFLTLADATLLANTIPIFIPFTAYFWKKIPIIHRLWWGIGVAFIGIILIINPGIGVFNPASFIGIAGAICGSVAVLALRFAHFSEPPYRTLFFYFFICSAVSFLTTLPRFSENWLDLTRDRFAVLAALGFLGFLYQLCFTYAAKWAPVRLSTPFLYLSVVFGMFIQWYIWNEPVSLPSIFGFILVFIGATLVVCLYPKEQR